MVCSKPRLLLAYRHFRPSDNFVTTLAYTFVGDRDDVTTVRDDRETTTRITSSISPRFYSPGIAGGTCANESVIARVQNLFDRKYSETFGFRSPP